MGEKITDKELLDRVVWDDADGYEVVAEEEGDRGRWRQEITCIFKRLSDGKLFSTTWYKGLTENCDHTDPEVAVEVEPFKHVIETISYKPVK